MNSVSQIAIYAFILQKETGLNVKSIIFNSRGAMKFDPNLSMQAINNFMGNNIQGWVPPWSAFSSFIPN